MEKITFENIPVWALYALEYCTNEDGSLSDEDCALVNDFANTNFPRGYTMDIHWNTQGFSYYPSFGLPCDVVTVDFYTDL